MQRPRLLTDNGSSYNAGDLAKWLGARNIKHLRSAPYHPMTQGKIERWSPRTAAAGREAVHVTPTLQGSHPTLRWREADSNHQYRETGDRSLGRMICCSRCIPRCR